MVHYCLPPMSHASPICCPPPLPQVHVVQQEDKPDGERLVVMKGAPERIIDRCSEVLLGSRVVPMTPELKAEIEAHQETLSRNGLRVLGYVVTHRQPSCRFVRQPRRLGFYWLGRICMVVLVG